MDLGNSMKGGYLTEIPPNAPPERQIDAINGIISTLNVLLKTQVLSDGTNKRMIFGYQKDGWGTGKDFGIKISKAGVDVMTATDDQLILSMDLETWNFYDVDGRNYMRFGKLNDSQGGIIVSKPGSDVEDVIS